MLEALRRIRATWKSYASKMEDGEVSELLRKESVIRGELRRRMRVKGIVKTETHGLEEKLIGHKPKESPLRMRLK